MFPSCNYLTELKIFQIIFVLKVSWNSFQHNSGLIGLIGQYKLFAQTFHEIFKSLRMKYD